MSLVLDWARDLFARRMERQLEDRPRTGWWAGFGPMSAARAIRSARRVIAGSRLERKRTLYRLSMACRGIDLTSVSLRELDLPEDRC
jgi:hypothetical protein